MLYLLAIIAPPFALCCIRKWGQAFLSFGLCFLALVGFFFFVIPGVVLTVVTILHAILVVHGRKADERTQKVVDAIENEAV